MSVPDKETMRCWAERHNMRYIETFHEKMRDFLRDEYHRISEKEKALTSNDREEPSNCNISKPELEKFDERLSSNTFLMMYSHAEEWFSLTTREVYAHNLMCEKGKPENNDLKRGYYLYREGDSEKVYVLVVHNNEQPKTLCLSEIAKEDNQKALLKELEWPKDANAIIILDKELEKLITSNCKHIPIKGKGLQRFEIPLKHKGLDVKSKPWQDLVKSSNIRNCILHANGRISLYNDPEAIKNEVKNKRFFKIENKDRIILLNAYILHIRKAIYDVIGDCIDPSKEKRE